MLYTLSATVLDLSFSPSHKEIYLTSHCISKSLTIAVEIISKGESFVNTVFLPQFNNHERGKI